MIQECVLAADGLEGTIVGVDEKLQRMTLSDEDETLHHLSFDSLDDFSDEDRGKIREKDSIRIFKGLDLKIVDGKFQIVSY